MLFISELYIFFAIVANITALQVLHSKENLQGNAVTELYNQVKFSIYSL